MVALLLILQAVAGPPGSLGDLDSSYCLETGYCRAPDDGFRQPPPGLLFLSIGVVTLGGIMFSRRKPTAGAPP